MRNRGTVTTRSVSGCSRMKDGGHVTDYTPIERQTYDKGSAFSTELLEKQLRGMSFVPLTRLGCPVFMFMGRHDALTPPSLAAAWLERVDAPIKGEIWFENSAHMMIIEEPGRMLTALLRLRPLSSGQTVGRQE